MMYVIIRNTEEEISEARNLLETEGIVHVLDLKLGRWFNRNPYEMYEFALENWVKGWFKPSRDGASEIRHHIKRSVISPQPFKWLTAVTRRENQLRYIKSLGIRLTTWSDSRNASSSLQPKWLRSSHTPVLSRTSKSLPPAEGKRKGSTSLMTSCFLCRCPPRDYPNERVVVKLLPHAP